MKLYKTDAIVLRAINGRDADQTLVLFSAEFGKLRVMAHGVRKPASRRRGALQPLYFSSFLLHKGSSVDSVRQCEGLESFPELLTDLYRLCYAGYVVDLVENSTAESESNEGLFRLLHETLRRLGDGDPELVALAFTIKLINFSGYNPVLNFCAGCHSLLPGKEIAFSPAAGGVLCPKCAGTRLEENLIRPHRGTVEILKLMLIWELSKLGQLKVDARTRQELITLLEAHMEYYFGYKCKVIKFIEKLRNRK